MSVVPPDWAPRLPSGERVLWAGAPSPRPGGTEAVQGGLAVLSLALAAVPAWLLATRSGAVSPVELGAMALAAGLLLYNAVASARLALRRIRQRPRTRYIITDARALACVLEEPPVLADAPLDEIPAPRRLGGAGVEFGRRLSPLRLRAPEPRVVFELRDAAEAEAARDVAAQARAALLSDAASPSGEPR